MYAPNENGRKSNLAPNAFRINNKKHNNVYAFSTECTKRITKRNVIYTYIASQQATADAKRDRIF